MALEKVSGILEEAKMYIRRNDPTQASEKLYKVAEECIKVLAEIHAKEVYDEATEKGRWTVALLDRAVRELSAKIDPNILHYWDNAWALHVWGFHEERLNIESIKARLPSVERLIKVAKESSQSS